MSTLASGAAGRAMRFGQDARGYPLLLAGGALGCVLLVTAVLGPAVAPDDRTAYDVLIPPSAEHWFGTDELGRDVFARAATGLRVSLFVGVVAAALATTLGVAMGAIAGYAGGVFDSMLMRITEVFMILPPFFVAIVVVAFTGPTVFNLTLVIGFLAWPIIARIVRVEFLSIKTRGFVDAARLARTRPATILTREVLPNALGPLIPAATLVIGQAMLAEAGLSYLGLGDPNNQSLGLMLQQAQPFIQLAWWTSVGPGLLLFLAVLGSNLIGNGMTDLRNYRGRSSQ